MRVIIAGSRTVRQYIHVVLATKRSGFDITEVVSGKQKSVDLLTKEEYGVDFFGERWAKSRGIPVKPFPANWSKYGGSAGPKRNAQMAEYGEALIAVWNGKSRGTKNMIDEAVKRNLKTYIYTVEQ